MYVLCFKTPAQLYLASQGSLNVYKKHEMNLMKTTTAAVLFEASFADTHLLLRGGALLATEKSIRSPCRKCDQKYDVIPQHSPQSVALISHDCKLICDSQDTRRIAKHKRHPETVDNGFFRIISAVQTL